MNRSWVLFHLGEAVEELRRTIGAIENDPDYCEAEFSVAIEHLYGHVNTAWNSRNATLEETSSGENFASWRTFPKDIDRGGR